MKTKRTFANERIPWCWVFLFSVYLGVSTCSAADTNAPAAVPPPMTPERMFEGGTNTYNNWIELGTGGFITSGNKAQAEQNFQSQNGAFGGIEDFHYGTNWGPNTTLSANGHALFDNRDYKLGLDLEQQNIGFLRFNYDQFRTWENGDGGFYPPAGTWFPLSDDALALDNGTISFEGGLRLQNEPNVPKITFKYTHTYRNGEEPSTSWGYTQPDPNNFNTVQGLSPSFYAIDEHSDTFQLDAADHIKTTDLGLGLRYETGNLNDSLNSVQSFGPGFSNQTMTDQSSVSYDMFNVHAFTETWLKENLMFSTAYSYSDLHNDFTGSYVLQPELSGVSGFDYSNLNGNSWVHDHVVNLNLYARLLKNLSIVPSLRVDKKDSDVNASEIETSAGIPATDEGDQSDLEVSERLDLTYTGVTNWVYYASGEWTEGNGNLNEYGGLIPINGGTQYESVQSQINNNRLFQKYSAGLRWYPLYRVSLDVGGYYENHDYNYNFPLDSTTNNNGGFAYPGFLVMQNFDTYDGNARLTLRPWQNISIVGRYEYQLSTIHTEPDPISGLGDTESSSMISHIIGANASWSPWSRLSLTAGFNYVLSETKTPASDYTQAILNAQNNYWTVNFSSDFVVDDKTDLNLSYYYYRADDYNNYATAGVPYGAGAEEHAVTAEIVRRITQNLRLTLKSGFYHYTDQASGGNNDFDAYLIFASMQYRF
ncbi:MAG: hypothetical protein WBN22_10040 [Verrucomicrobiia bacterium]